MANSLSRRSGWLGICAIIEIRMMKLDSKRRSDDVRTWLLRAVILVAAAAIASAGCTDDSPTGPIAQTRVDARVQDSTGSSMVTGSFAGNFRKLG